MIRVLVFIICFSSLNLFGQNKNGAGMIKIRYEYFGNTTFYMQMKKYLILLLIEKFCFNINKFFYF